jgi:2-oxoisovalerate dehydrogenase E1 component alpha subunit
VLTRELRELGEVEGELRNMHSGLSVRAQQAAERKREFTRTLATGLANLSRISEQVQGVERISDRGVAFGMRTKTIDGNDPISAYLELKEAFEYVRAERKPYLVEARVSRLFGHSSASGANFSTVEEDCLALFEDKLEKHGVRTRAEAKQLREQFTEQFAELARQAKEEPFPDGRTIWDHVYAGEPGIDPLAD